MSEQLVKWEPTAGLDKKYYIQKMSDNIDGLEIVLVNALDESKKLVVFFKGGAVAFRKTDETFRLALVEELNKKHSTHFYSEWTFFKVVNSTYLQWLLEQSNTISAHYNLQHFAFITDDEILDVVSDSEPEINFLK